MPKRAVVAISATALALVLLFSFKTPDEPGLDATDGSTGQAIVAPTSRAVAPTSQPAAPTQASGDDESDDGSTPAPQATSAPQATQAPAAGALTDGTVAGPVVSTRFGPVQVQITISNGKVTAVDALELPSDHPRSAAISDYAAPILQSEALQAQSAQIDGVSGATYTSVAYERSLQAALDQARG